MVFTAVLAAIAVIAAMVHVPGAEAQDGETEYTSVTVSYTHLTLPTIILV